MVAPRCNPRSTAPSTAWPRCAVSHRVLRQCQCRRLGSRRRPALPRLRRRGQRRQRPRDVQHRTGRHRGRRRKHQRDGHRPHHQRDVGVQRLHHRHQRCAGAGRRPNRRWLPSTKTPGRRWARWERWCQPESICRPGGPARQRDRRRLDRAAGRRDHAPTAATARGGSPPTTAPAGAPWRRGGASARLLSADGAAHLLPAQRRLQRHAKQRDHLPRLGPHQRQQRRQRGHDR